MKTNNNHWMIFGKIKCVLIGFIMIGFSISTLKAQNIQAISKLKWEDAELNYIKGNFSKSLQLINEIEKMLGSTSPKTLYLKILIQDTLFHSIKKYRLPSYSNVDSVRRNIKYYIDNFYTVSEEKYRTIYEVSEKYKQFPESSVEFEKWRFNKMSKFTNHLNQLLQYKDSLTLEREKRVSKNYRDSVLKVKRNRRFIWFLTSVYSHIRLYKGIVNWQNTGYYYESKEVLNIVIPSIYSVSTTAGLLDNHKSKGIKYNLNKEIQEIDDILIKLDNSIEKTRLFVARSSV